MLIYFLCYFSLLNLFGLGLMYWDKQRAIRQQWRIPEIYLFICCISGGFLGIYCGMKYLRHKSLHRSFHWAVRLSALCWLVIFPLVMIYYAGTDSTISSPKISA